MPTIKQQSFHTLSIRAILKDLATRHPEGIITMAQIKEAFPGRSTTNIVNKLDSIGRGIYKLKDFVPSSGLAAEKQIGSLIVNTHLQSIRSLSSSEAINYSAVREYIFSRLKRQDLLPKDITFGLDGTYSIEYHPGRYSSFSNKVVFDAARRLSDTRCFNLAMIAESKGLFETSQYWRQMAAKAVDPMSKYFVDANHKQILDAIAKIYGDPGIPWKVSTKDYLISGSMSNKGYGVTVNPTYSYAQGTETMTLQIENGQYTHPSLSRYSPKTFVQSFGAISVTFKRGLPLVLAVGLTYPSVATAAEDQRAAIITREVLAFTGAVLGGAIAIYMAPVTGPAVVATAWSSLAVRGFIGSMAGSGSVAAIDNISKLVVKFLRDNLPHNKILFKVLKKKIEDAVREFKASSTQVAFQAQYPSALNATLRVMAAPVPKSSVVDFKSVIGTADDTEKARDTQQDKSIEAKLAQPAADPSTIKIMGKRQIPVAPMTPSLLSSSLVRTLPNIGAPTSLPPALQLSSLTPAKTFQRLDGQIDEMSRKNSVAAQLASSTGLSRASASVIAPTLGLSSLAQTVAQASGASAQAQQLVQAHTSIAASTVSRALVPQGPAITDRHGFFAQPMRSAAMATAHRPPLAIATPTRVNPTATSSLSAMGVTPLRLPQATSSMASHHTSGQPSVRTLVVKSTTHYMRYDYAGPAQTFRQAEFNASSGNAWKK